MTINTAFLSSTPASLSSPMNTEAAVVSSSVRQVDLVEAEGGERDDSDGSEADRESEVGFNDGEGGDTAPLVELMDNIEQFRGSVQGSVVALTNGLKQRSEAAEAREILELLLDTFHVVYKVEKLIKELPSVPADWSNGDVNLAEKNLISNRTTLQHAENESNLRDTQSMLLERIAGEMNWLKFYIANAQNLPFIENMEKRIQGASLLLDASLGGSVLKFDGGL